MAARPTKWQEALESMARDVVSSLERRHGDDLVSAVLYGSVARGEARSGSDVDLLLVFRDLPRDRTERFRIFWDALEENRARVQALYRDGIAFDWSPILLTTEEAREHSPLYLEMTLDARMLVDRDGFFAGVLDGFRARLRELGSKRVALPDGSAYWVLKPGKKPGEVVEL